MLKNSKEISKSNSKQKNIQKKKQIIKNAINLLTNFKEIKKRR